MKKLLVVLAALVMAGCSTLRVGDVSYNSVMSTTDTLTITRPDGSKIDLKGKATLDPSILNHLIMR